MVSVEACLDSPYAHSGTGKQLSQRSKLCFLCHPEALHLYVRIGFLSLSFSVVRTWREGQKAFRGIDWRVSHFIVIAKLPGVQQKQLSRIVCVQHEQERRGINNTIELPRSSARKSHRENRACHVTAIFKPR